MVVRSIIFISFIFFFFTGLLSQTRKKENDILYREAFGDSYKEKMCRLDVSYLKDKRDLPVLVIFHGGGLTGGDKSIPHSFYLSNIIVVSANYRLSPNVLSPEYVDDAACAIKWVFDNIENYGGDKSRVYISGESAGAYLASLVTLDKKYLMKYSVDVDLIAGCFPLSGQMTTHFTVIKESGIDVDSSSPYIDKMAPLYHTRYTPFPIIAMIGCRNKDMPGRYEQNLQLVNQLRSNGTKSALVEFAFDDHVTLYPSAYDVIIPMIEKQRFIWNDTTYLVRPNVLNPDLNDSIWHRAQIFDTNGVSIENIDGYPKNYQKNKTYIYVYREKSGRSFSRKISLNY
ncbi:MAG: alpha/beta hydrolase [Bacteroidales bacterium]